MKKIGVAFILGCMFFFRGYAGSIELNNSRLFTAPDSKGEYLYFSILNPHYEGNDADEQMLFNAAKEIAKFLSLDLGYVSEGYPLGSFYLNNATYYIDYDTDTINECIPSLKAVLPEHTRYGEVSAVKIAAKDLEALWETCNPGLPYPDYQTIEKYLRESDEEWYCSIPSCKGYIFGLGISDGMSSIEKNTANADYNAMVDLLNTIKIQVTSESYLYNCADLQLYYLFSRQHARGTISGIKIIRRYYSETLHAAFSLAVLRFP